MYDDFQTSRMIWSRIYFIHPTQLLILFEAPVIWFVNISWIYIYDLQIILVLVLGHTFFLPWDANITRDSRRVMFRHCHVVASPVYVLISSQNVHAHYLLWVILSEVAVHFGRLRRHTHKRSIILWPSNIMC